MWFLIENVLCVLEMHVFYAFVGSCDLYMPVQCLLHFSEIFNVRCIYIFTCSSFLVNWPFYHYTIFISLHFFFLQFILSDITVSPAFFRMDFFHPLTVHLSMSLGLWVLPVSTLWQTLCLLPCVFPPVTCSSGPCACASYGGERQTPWTALFMPL